VEGLRRRRTELAVFALLALVTELTGRSITARLDRAFHVTPVAAPRTSYYPFLLSGVRLLAAIALAAIVWRLVRAHATASAGEAVLRAVGQRGFRPPSLRLSLSLRLWVASFGATALWFLIQNDLESLSEGRWPVLAPWLHTYALVVFAGLAVIFALVWGAVREWLQEVERFAAATLAHVCRVFRAETPPLRLLTANDDNAPRHLFGVVFESRPPPAPA
jgi:hypothetical protein